MAEKGFSINPTNFPIEHEPKIPTMDKPLIIESACPGWQEAGKRYPAIPISLEDQVREIADSVRAGAAAIHVHPRDPVTGKGVMSYEILKEIMDGVFAEVGVCVTISHTWVVNENKVVDYITHTEKLLKAGGGNRYCQGGVVVPPGRIGEMSGAFHSREGMLKGVKWLEENGVKPIFQLHDTYTHLDYKRHVFDTGLSRRLPFVMNLNMGKHDSHAVHRDPWSYIQLISNFHMVQETIPSSLIGLDVGGRNWLPLVNLGILMGVQVVRVGIEDSYWMYPHRDEIIPKNSDVIEKIYNLATMLGRRVVTDPDEARSILGLKLT